jgi:uncharacterized membrane protein
MTSPPSRWLDRLLGLAFTILAVALMLHIAARLIVTVLPALIIMGIVAVGVFVGFVIYQSMKWRL